ncbi:hypothetical protein SynBIOSE41_01932 [Synechococcus sp. BIOS-E4-1]|nr:hypothetical protein SynBIOSE41_01932 [Synechococcus sp. BIOS-E4-1]
MGHLGGLLLRGGWRTQGTPGKRQSPLPLLLDQGEGNEIWSSSHHDNLSERILSGQGRSGAESGSWLN